jgi:N6-adenosine-specific RNA methylase IME4
VRRYKAQSRATCRGEILRNTKFDKGGGDRKSVDYKNHRLHAVTGDRVTLKSLGIRKFESCRWQTIASISRERFEEEIAKTIRGKKELTERQFIELARTIKIKEKFAMLANSDSPTCNVEDLLALANSGKKFGCIYIDPPWRVGKVPYPTMDVAEIAELPIAKLASDWSHVDLWTLDQYFCDAKDLLRKWGFEYKSPLIWAKTQMGRGSYWRSSHEYLLLGVRGGMPFRAHDVKSWIEAARTEHSVKPEIFREILERVSPGPYLELFARNNRPGWTCWGNEIERVKFLNSLTDDTKFEYDDVG